MLACYVSFIVPYEQTTGAKPICLHLFAFGRSSDRTSAPNQAATPTHTTKIMLVSQGFNRRVIKQIMDGLSGDSR